MTLVEFFAPQPLTRLAFLRICLPLAILGFLSLRIPHAVDWLSVEGFSVPELKDGDWRQPVYFPPLPVWAAWAVCAATVLSGILFSIGYKTRWAGLGFAACLIYLALADRLAAFTVNKLGPVLIVALALTPCGESHGWDAAKRGKDGPEVCTWGNVRFFQVLLVLVYALNGLAKIRGDWLDHPQVLFTHLQDSYQTMVSYLMARHMPLEIWQGLRWLVLGFETLAPLWFSLAATRFPALCIGLGMHAFIGLAFGPVLWFALLMSLLLVGCFGPRNWLTGFFRFLEKPAALVIRIVAKPG